MAGCLMNTLTPEKLEAMLDRAAKKGAKQALCDLGLSDMDAASDIRELRSLLDSWRDTKKSIWKTLVQLGTQFRQRRSHWYHLY